MKVLVVKIGAMGDVLMATPLLREVRRRHPAAQIHFLVGRWSASVLEKNPHIDKHIVVSDKTFYGMRPIGLFLLWLKLFFTFYTRIYLFHRNLGYFVYFNSLGSNLIGTRKAILRVLPLFGRDRFPKGVHNTLAFWNILGGPSPRVQEQQPEFPFSQERIDFLKLNGLTESWKKEKLRVMINPGGGTNPGEQVTVRQWGAKNYAAFIGLLADRRPDFHVLLSGGQDDEALCERILISPELGGLRNRITSISGKTNLHELRMLLEEADLFITGDTGGMHVAASAGTPTLSIFGPTDPVEKAPLIPNAVVVKTAGRCAPCYHGKFHGCSYAFCMSEISPRQVLLESERLLDLTHAR